MFLTHHARRAAHRLGFTMVELLVVMSIILLLVGLLLPALGAARQASYQLKNTSQLAGHHQVMILYAESNGTYLPGLDSGGRPTLNTFGTATASTNSSLVSSRYWALLNGQYIPPPLAIAPVDVRPAWVAGPVTTSNFSYAMLSIADGSAKQDRNADWRDNATAQTPMMSDREVGTGLADDQIQSIWGASPGDWKGSIVWGDSHAEFFSSCRGLATLYGSTVNTNDNLFADVAHAGQTEGGSTGTNALMVDTTYVGVNVNTVLYTYFADADGDGYGDPNNSITSASSVPPTGYVADNTDKDDANALVH